MIGIIAGCKEQDNYTRWLEHYRLPYRIIHNEAEAAEVSVMIFCGGPDLGLAPERDALDQRIFAYCRTHHVPMWGGCRGMQEIAHFLGAPLIPDLGELNAVHRSSEGKPRRHLIHLSNGEIMEVNSAHHQAVETPPFSCDLSAKAEDGTWELMINHAKQLFLVQSHPEREEMWGSEIEQLCIRWIQSRA